MSIGSSETSSGYETMKSEDDMAETVEMTAVDDYEETIDPWTDDDEEPTGPPLTPLIILVTHGYARAFKISILYYKTILAE